MLRGGSPSRCSFVDSTKVAFKALNEESISSYLAEINPLDKAGAYAAQEDRGRLIERIEGSLENVIGLPVALVIAAIQQHFTVPSSG
jgi:septum formation protein